MYNKELENKKKFKELVGKLAFKRFTSSEPEKEKELSNKIEGVLLAAELVFDYDDYADIVLTAYSK